jgi:hypothetical protein
MTLRTILHAVVLLALAACPLTRTEPAPTPPGAVPSNLVLRSYEVPNNGAQRLRGVLRELLWFGSDGKDSNKYVGRADVGPDGRLIVLAPDSVHEGVKALVASVTTTPVKEPGSIRIDYWVVSGAPGKSEPPAANLKEVSAALTEVEKNDGPMAFTLVEKLTVSSMSNERATMDGRDTRVRQGATADGATVVADLDLERFGQRMQTRVRLKPGALAVLASAGMTSKDQGEAGRTVYFLVRMAMSDGAGQ